MVPLSLLEVVSLLAVASAVVVAAVDAAMVEVPQAPVSRAQAEVIALQLRQAKVSLSQSRGKLAVGFLQHVHVLNANQTNFHWTLVVWRTHLVIEVVLELLVLLGVALRSAHKKLDAP